MVFAIFNQLNFKFDDISKTNLLYEWSVRVGLNIFVIVSYFLILQQIQDFEKLLISSISYLKDYYLINLPQHFFINQYQMTNKAELEKVHFHSFAKPPRLNNPTFMSSFVNDSLTLFTPQKVQKQQTSKATEYKSNFEPFTDKKNTIYLQPHYHRCSKDAFQKSRSYLSQYGTNLLSQNLSNVSKK